MKISDFLNKEALDAFDKFSKQYKAASPYSHITINNFFKEDVAKELAQNFPAKDSDFWYEYNNPIEKKLACDDIRKFPLLFAKVVHALNGQEFLGKLESLTEIKGLSSDPYLHGGGLHCTKNGGKLDIHLDYSIHPKLKLERRINMIIYLSPDWKEEWGGHFEMWNNDITKLEKKVAPIFNQAVIFNTDDLSFHGHPDPLQCPEDRSRNSIALYYLTTPREHSSSRPRARFFARPWEDYDEKLEEFRKKRSEVSGIY